MSVIDKAKQRKLVASLRLLESDVQGERDAALQAIFRLLPDGLSLADMVHHGLGGTNASPPPQPSWQRIARTIANFPWELEPKERSFARNMAGARYEPTPKQMEWLTDIARRLGVTE